MSQTPLSGFLTFDEMLEVIEVNNTPKGIIAVDTETTGEDIRDGRGYCMGVSIAGRLTRSKVLSGYYPFRHPVGDNLDSTDKLRLKESLEKFKGSIIFHNAKFDLVSLHTLGIVYAGKFWDTLLMCHLINRNFPYSKDLNSCVRTYVDKSEKKKTDDIDIMVKLRGWAGVPSDVMEEYAAYDANLTLRLYECIRALFDTNVPIEFWEHKQDFVRCISDMERRGVEVDVPLCKRMSAIGRLQLEETQEVLGYNLASPIDLEKLLIDKLDLPVIRRGKSGRPSFDKEVMREYEEILEFRDGDETAETVLVYRGWQKAVTSNYEPYVTLLSSDGRLRPNYKLHGTKTGRMSCEKPNLQQIPILSDKPWNGAMKACFVPMEGYSLWEADYKQLELRIGAAYGHETFLLEVLNDPDRDVFTEMSKELSFTRYDTKHLTYAMGYGSGAKHLSHVFNVPLERGTAIRDKFWATYPGIKEVSDRSARLIRVKGRLKLWSGRYISFMYPSDEAHKAFSHVCQGGAADLVNYAMVRLHKKVDNEEECRMLLQVHDSIVFEIKNGCEDKYLPIIKEVMEKDNPPFGVHFPIDIHKWGEG